MNSNTTKKYLFSIIAVIAIFLLGYKTGSFFATNKTSSLDDETTDKREYEEESNVSEEKVVPQKVLKILKHIREFDEAPEGYVGGRIFKNREGVLPKVDDDNQKIKYQEWDVNPKVSGKNRGAERLVTSSKDAYYTEDHYKTFTKIDE